MLTHLRKSLSFLLALFLAADETSARKKLKVDVMQRFLEPNFSMFETQETTYTVDEYGASIDDLQFRDIQSADTRWSVINFIFL